MRNPLVEEIGVAILALFMAWVIGDADHMNAVERMTIEQIDFTQVPDGTYPGEFAFQKDLVKVTAVVAQGRLSEIKLVASLPKWWPPEARDVLTKAVELQSISFETPKKARSQSKAILKAVESAVTGTHTPPPGVVRGPASLLEIIAFWVACFSAGCHVAGWMALRGRQVGVAQYWVKTEKVAFFLAAVLMVLGPMTLFRV